jgi:hypothetical protein
MSDNPFERVMIYPQEKPLSDDPNRCATELDRSLRDVLYSLFSARLAGAVDVGYPRTGFMGNGFKVYPSTPAAMSVLAFPGLGFKMMSAVDQPTNINGANGVDDPSYYKPLVLTNASGQTFTVPTAPVSGIRIDIIEVKLDRHVADPSSRLVFNPGAGEFQAGLLSKTLSFNLDGRIGQVTSPADNTAGLGYKIGVASATPAVPAVSPGYLKIAEIIVPSGTTSIVSNLIADYRRLLMPNGTIKVRGRVNGSGLAAFDAPPGVLGTFIPGGAGAPGCFHGNLYVVAGGHPNAGTDALMYPTLIWGSAMVPGTTGAPGSPFSGYIVGPSYPVGANGALVQTVDSGLQTALAGATPPLAVACSQAGGNGGQLIINAGMGVMRLVKGTGNTLEVDPTWATWTTEAFDFEMNIPQTFLPEPV